MRILLGAIAGGALVLTWQKVWRNVMWGLFSLGD